MTAPGQEPDEVMTSKPGGDEEAEQLRDLNKIGDNHMPEDLREAEREKGSEDLREAERERGAEDTSEESE